MSSLPSIQPAYTNTRRWRRHKLSVPIRVILPRPSKTTIIDGCGHELSEGGMALTAGIVNQAQQILSTQHKRILEAESLADEPPRV